MVKSNSRSPLSFPVTIELGVEQARHAVARQPGDHPRIG